MSESIDTSLLRVPFESLKRTSRDRKYVIDSLQAILRALKETADQPAPDEERQQRIRELIGRVLELQRTLVSSTQTETEDAWRCKARLQHLKDIGPAPKDHVLDWNRKRLPLLLADHLLRTGYRETASFLVAAKHLQGLVDEHIFKEAEPILKGLEEHNCSPALAWCMTNRAKLKKGKSKLEFHLRMQEFIELVRKGDRLGAIGYSQKHLATWAASYLPELQRALAALVFGAQTSCKPYAALFLASQWGAVTDLFLQELFRLHSMTQESLLAIQLQAGLSALKAPPGATDHQSKEDPLHHESFQALAQRLPYAKHVHSRLVCAVTKEVMDEHNPPIVLPNGTVYSERAIDQGIVNDSFADPVSGEVFPRSEMRRAYIS